MSRIKRRNHTSPRASFVHLMWTLHFQSESWRLFAFNFQSESWRLSKWREKCSHYPTLPFPPWRLKGINSKPLHSLVFKVEAMENALLPYIYINQRLGQGLGPSGPFFFLFNYFSFLSFFMFISSFFLFLFFFVYVLLDWLFSCGSATVPCAVGVRLYWKVRVCRVHVVCVDFSGTHVRARVSASDFSVHMCRTECTFHALFLFNKKTNLSQLKPFHAYTRERTCFQFNLGGGEWCSLPESSFFFFLKPCTPKTLLNNV